MADQFILFDTEYASWQGFLTAPEAEKKKAEIVQIAALKINDADLSITEELNIYIKPHFAPRLTDYFIKLTGITDNLLQENGLPFPAAYAKFKQFAGKLPCYSHSWSSGDDIADGKVFGYNLEMFGIQDQTPPDYHNIADWFCRIYRQKNIPITCQSSGQIAKLLGGAEELSRLGLDEHNALYDVYSILYGLRKFNFSVHSGSPANL